MSPVDSRHTVPLQRLVLVCSAIFVIGTALQNFVIIDEQAMRSMMELSGYAPERAAAEAPGNRFGPVGLLPTIVTDGGAALLAVVLLASLARYRRPWAFT